MSNSRIYLTIEEPRKSIIIQERGTYYRDVIVPCAVKTIQASAAAPVSAPSSQRKVRELSTMAHHTA
jgi:hypothetical protein